MLGFLPNNILVEMVKNLEENQAIFFQDEVIAFYSKENQEEVDFDTYEIIEFNEDCIRIENECQSECCSSSVNLFSRDFFKYSYSARKYIIPSFHREFNIFLRRSIFAVVLFIWLVSFNPKTRQTKQTS